MVISGISSKLKKLLFNKSVDNNLWNKIKKYLSEDVNIHPRIISEIEDSLNDLNSNTFLQKTQEEL